MDLKVTAIVVLGVYGAYMTMLANRWYKTAVAIADQRIQVAVTKAIQEQTDAAND